MYIVKFVIAGSEACMVKYMSLLAVNKVSIVKSVDTNSKLCIHSLMY